ncbi:choline/carnitine O-acyltransferase [Enterococcus florum]|uniref:choline/carnitine O-acyltransferase n=1 Tax=Enterococcus florum TaxID=2480627 RepID=UPI0015884379|nr:choline/carnitine O-acyltransferase [Enterococcus florum]
MKIYKEELLPHIPKLPLPDLADTLKALLDWAEPVTDPQELAAFKAQTESFEKSQGQVLQERLKAHQAQTAGSWLADFWQEMYLESRGCLQSESNFALVIQPSYYDQISSKAEKAARLIYCLSAIYFELVQGHYPLEKNRDDRQVDMSFYLNFFKSCRIPGSHIDRFYRGEMTAENSSVLVIHQGNYYQVKVTDEVGQPYSLEQLVKTLQTILQQKDQATLAEKRLAHFTGLPREASATLYQQLRATKTNQAALRSIEDALFAVNFSAGPDDTVEERIFDLLLNPHDQFITKTLQATITQQGWIGINIEHTAVDGVPAMNLLTRVFKRFQQEPLQTGRLSKVDLAERLEWQLTKDDEAALAACETVVAAENNSYTIQHKVVNCLGKKQIKQSKTSPDAFFHIALTMAQFRTFHCLKSVYEPVAMRGFYQGRTECARAVSKEKKQFIEFLTEYECAAATKEQVLEAFQLAAKAHGERIRQCQQGLGVERHLFGLQKMLEPTECPDAFFSTDCLKAVTSNFISTTGIPYELLESFSFGPVDKDGYGLYYGLLEEKIMLTLSSKKEQAEKGRELLEQTEMALKELYELLT